MKEDKVADPQMEVTPSNTMVAQEEKSSTNIMGAQKGESSTDQMDAHKEKSFTGQMDAQKEESSTGQVDAQKEEMSTGETDPQKAESSTSQISDDDWKNYRDKDIMQQHSAIQAEEAIKIPFVGDKEPLSSLEAEYKSGGCPILLEKIKILSKNFVAIRRTRGDGNCFFRSFMFAYLEYILESQDQAEVNRIKVNVEECRKTLLNLGYAEFTFEDFFSLFLDQLESVIQGSEASISHDELVERSREQAVSDYVVMFFRFITSGELRKRSEFFEPFIDGLAHSTVDQFCKSSVEPMGEESDHMHITALSDTLGVPIRVVYLDRSASDDGSVNVNHHDFVPVKPESSSTIGNEAVNPFITLLYRPGHYDILYKPR